jgi:hypothetical protein
MSRVVVMIPSRNRPDSLLRAWESVRDTSEASVLAYVDGDQADLYAGLPATYVGEQRQGCNKYRTGPLNRFVICVGTRIGPVQSINQLCHAARPGGGLRSMFPNADIWTYMTDDSTIRPSGWDRYLTREIDGFPNQMGVLSLFHGGDYVNFYALSTRMVGAVGFYGVPTLHAWYWDTAMELVGDATRMVYSRPEDVEIQHHQEQTKDSLGQPTKDLEQFHRWMITERKRIIRDVRQAMKQEVVV